MSLRAGETIALFVYGTLLEPGIMRRVCGTVPSSRPASLRGFVRGGIAGEPYPAIIRSPGSRVEGRLYSPVPSRLIVRLDRYEGRMYRRWRVLVDVAGESRPAHVYVLAPTFERRFRRGGAQPTGWQA